MGFLKGSLAFVRKYILISRRMGGEGDTRTKYFERDGPGKAGMP